MKNNLIIPFENNIHDIIKISQEITYEKYIDDVLNLIVTVTASITPIKNCSLWLINKKEKPWIIRLKAFHGISADLFEHPFLALSQGIVGRVAACRQSLIIEDVLKNEQFKEKNMARKLGLVSMLGVPIIYKSNDLLGVLNGFTTKPYKFSKVEVNLARSVANQAAITIFNTERMVRAKFARNELDTHDLLRRAGRVLMRQCEIDAYTASNWIQQCSRRSCKSLRQIAEAILLTS